MANKINDDRLRNLQTYLIYYTKNDSSSVTVETAESILMSVDYTVSMYLKQFDTVDEIIDHLRNENIDYMLEKGNRIIKLNVEYTKNLLNKVKKTRLNINNYSYIDTIDYGIDKFFKTYDDFFCAQGGDADIDYQLAIDVGNYLGIEFIRKYLERLNLENEFCHYFKSENIEKLLYGYDKKNELLLINIFEIILTNSIGLMIINEDIKILDITENNKLLIYNCIKDLTYKELTELFSDACNKIIDILSIKDNSLIIYIHKCCELICQRVNVGLKNHNLNNIFISFREEEEEQVLEYIDKYKLSNKKFRYIIELIRNAPNIVNKIELINMKIKSLIDLNDMLDSECLFDYEYDELFKSLSKINIILLAKYIEEYGTIKDWHAKFYDFIDKMSEDEKAYMNKLKTKIVLK